MKNLEKREEVNDNTRRSPGKKAGSSFRKRGRGDPRTNQDLIGTENLFFWHRPSL
jgi:hypothetical protein